MTPASWKQGATEAGSTPRRRRATGGENAASTGRPLELILRGAFLLPLSPTREPERSHHADEVERSRAGQQKSRHPSRDPGLHRARPKGFEPLTF